MNIRYKLTIQDLTTYNNTKWVLNEWKETSGLGSLCNTGWLHCYSNLILAVLLNPTHANITNPRLFKCEVDGECLTDNGMKEGWTRMRIIEEMELPQLSHINKIAFGILCALEVNKDEKFVLWANNWLENKDRSKESARAVYRYAANAANAAAVDGAFYRDYADAAVYAARYAASANANIGLITLAERAMEIK